MDRLAEMSALCAVVESGSITAAAARMDIAKSAVSRRLRDLESRLGVELFHRTTRHLTPTDTGSAFYERARRVLDDLDDAEASTAHEHVAVSGRLRAAVPASFGAMHVGPALGAFAERHPHVQLDLDVSDRHSDLVAEGIDVALRISRLQDSTLIARRLAPIRYVACAAPAYLERRGAPASPADLARHDCLTYSGMAKPHVWHYVTDDGVEAEARVGVQMRADNGEFLREAALCGMGITCAPTFMVCRHLEAGTLVPVLTDCEWRSAQLHAVWPQTRHLSARVRAFVEFFAERFAEPPYWDWCLGDCTGERSASRADG